MDMRKFTEKSALALQKAQSLAREYGNQEIGQVHLLYALVTAEDGLIGQLLTKMGKDTNAFASDTEKEIVKLVKVRGGEQYISKTLASALEEAEAQMGKMGDSFDFNR